MGESQILREGIAQAIVDQLWMKGLITDTERKEINRNLSENLQKAA